MCIDEKCTHQFFWHVRFQCGRQLIEEKGGLEFQATPCVRIDNNGLGWVIADAALPALGRPSSRDLFIRKKGGVCEVSLHLIVEEGGQSQKEV
jgi:hypothetical protein